MNDSSLLTWDPASEEEILSIRRESRLIKSEADHLMKPTCHQTSITPTLKGFGAAGNKPVISLSLIDKLGRTKDGKTMMIESGGRRRRAPRASRGPGGNWKASGYDLGLLPFTTSASEQHASQPTNGTISLLSKRSFSTPSVKLDAEYLTQRFQLLARQSGDLAESIISLLAVDADEILITSEPKELNCIDWVGPDTADMVLKQVLNLIKNTGLLLLTAESLHLGASLEVDLDQFLWVETNQENKNAAMMKSLTEQNLNAEALGPICAQLQFAQRLVCGYERAKQALYHMSADLVYATQMMLTSGAAFWMPPVASPAQPLSALPLFTVHQPAASRPTPGRLVKTARRLVLAPEGLSAAVNALAQEAAAQANQEGTNKLAAVKQVVKSGILQSSSSSSTTPFSDNFPPNAIPRRLKSISSAGASISPYRNTPPSPRHPLHARGIEEEQADLGRSSSNPLHARDGSLDDNPLSRKHAPSLIQHGNEKSESALSQSPTRSKKLAKFLGDDAATSAMPAPKSSSSKPASLSPDYGPDDISSNADHQIRGGTLRGLVIKLTLHKGRTSAVPFLRVFLITYFTFHIRWEVRLS
ncbi:hypothetical protein PCASD_26007 [Puccinia coronata f. sp. avenae]|uniref:N-terminal Ras-GEF domain-containing protein n=1 Tax=Puccinia coronata f. sp. avenae TaxID=200324 RepID=A0A2N5RTX8_9BASI|nr:hypothetical protein PCASD_26007 [Puccinia coronata f. sp. avenae]